MINTIKWTENRIPNDECGYHHTIGETPFGRFLLTWKPWKENISESLGFDETPWGEIEYHTWGSIDVAKQWAERNFKAKIREALGL